MGIKMTTSCLDLLTHKGIRMPALIKHYTSASTEVCSLLTVYLLKMLLIHGDIMVKTNKQTKKNTS